MNEWIMKCIVLFLGVALLGCLGIVTYCQMQNVTIPAELVAIASSISGGFLGVVTGQKIGQ